MKKWIVFILLVAFIAGGCGGSLSSEQRKKIRENMEAGAIKKVSDAELMEAAFAYGRNIEKIVKGSSQQRLLDSLEKAYGVEILYMEPGDSVLRRVEKQIIEAYTSGATSVEINDNIQKMGADSILYTKPIMVERPDGSLEFTKALGVRVPKKRVILSLKD
jgi:uncharacterized protein YbaP (TraB family)